MSWAERGFVAVDWGSTARRAYALDASGRVTDEMEDELGTLAVPRAEFPAAVAALRRRFGDAPMLMAGMVGSNRGWIEAPYVPCPATSADIAARLCWAEPGRVAIVPGLSLVDGDDADVMRGEEAQVVGLEAMAAGSDATICHPGTHSKWIEVQGGRIARFRTVMTGELFSLLRHHSILADLLDGEATAGPAFLAGVERGFATGALGAELFAVRARVLLGVGERGDAASRASGVLIGGDLRTGLADAGTGLAAADAGREIQVVGRGSLTALYAAALRHVGRRTREIDGAAAFTAGLRAIAATIG